MERIKFDSSHNDIISEIILFLKNFRSSFNNRTCFIHLAYWSAILMRPNCWKLVGIEKPEIFIRYVSTGRNDEPKGKIVLTDTNILNVFFFATHERKAPILCKHMKLRILKQLIMQMMCSSVFFISNWTQMLEGHQAKVSWNFQLLQLRKPTSKFYSKYQVPRATANHFGLGFPKVGWLVCKKLIKSKGIICSKCSYLSSTI